MHNDTVTSMRPSTPEREQIIHMSGLLLFPMETPRNLAEYPLKSYGVGEGMDNIHLQLALGVRGEDHQQGHEYAKQVGAGVPAPRVVG